MLKVLHVPYTFAPDPVGGTEIYVEALAHSLHVHHFESVIAAPSSKGESGSYDYNGLRVRRYSLAQESKHILRELYGGGDPTSRDAFATVLQEENPDCVHFHAFTRAVSILHVRSVKERGIPAFFTYHTPAVSCQRGTLIHRGTAVCDGKLNVHRCTACVLQSRGAPDWLATAIKYTPHMVTKAIDKSDLSGRIWTALRMAELVRAHGEAFLTLMREIDGVVALSNWVHELLVRNGVPGSKIVLSPHGVPDVSEGGGPLVDLEGHPLRVAFLGRADRTKGIDTLIRAVRSAPNLQIELHLYGVTQGPMNSGYRRELGRLAESDRRIVFKPPVPHGTVVSLLRDYHLLAVPSRWLETGPLVVLEALSAGTPVIGSDLGSIARWIQHERNGLLVPFDDITEWASALKRCAEDRNLLKHLRNGVKPPRRMSEVALEMARMYSEHINSPKYLRAQCNTGLGGFV